MALQKLMTIQTKSQCVQPQVPLFSAPSDSTVDFRSPTWSARCPVTSWGRPSPTWANHLHVRRSSPSLADFFLWSCNVSCLTSMFLSMFLCIKMHQMCWNDADVTYVAWMIWNSSNDFHWPFTISRTNSFTNFFISAEDFFGPGNFGLTWKGRQLFEIWPKELGYPSRHPGNYISICVYIYSIYLFTYFTEN